MTRGKAAAATPDPAAPQVPGQDAVDDAANAAAVEPGDTAPEPDAGDIAQEPDPGEVEVEVEPDVVDPDADVVEPEAIEPTAVEPAAIEPAAVEPAAVEPAAVDSEQGEEVEPETQRATETVLQVRGLSKRFGSTLAVDGVDLDVSAGSFFGVVGPNGAGKTTTLSMITGLLRPDAGTVRVHGIDVWADPDHAKRTIGVLPDGLRLFDRLTGAQLLFYSGVLRGLAPDVVRQRTADLIDAFALGDAAARLVADYSAGMTKKVALAAAMIHAPRVLVLDEPFESVDPVSSANLVEILQRYVASGGTVVLSSHGMDLIQRVCDHVAIVVGGRVLAAGTIDEVRQGRTLEERFVQLAGGRRVAAGMEWLHSFTE